MSPKVSQSTGYAPNVQMSAFGYVMAIILVIVLLPMLPILVLAWILWKIFVPEQEHESRFESWRTESGKQPSNAS
ncbi:DUF7535 family protein [Natrarchaeobius oligotrophus]|uniref:Uncharacterized protein n=1 Tax=Natrarchaeobius chitinivorans TaxID=1679083 RepID=A0A3N6MLK4_NATCH|nr:hypothetical protein [Natrarchaeobius chitinivorans]RQG98200.1 hypothetical protein EA472_18550 [Natrarchaeobius chitinivorans]